MNQMRKKGLSLLLATAFALALSGQCAAASGGATPPASDATEVSQLIQDYWEEDYFDQVIIDPEREQVTMDGTDTTLEAALGLEPAETETVLESAQSAEAYFQDTAYETEQTAAGSVVVTAPYQTRRIVVETPTLSDTQGAEQTLCDAQTGQYILQYATQEDAQRAYEALSAQYGADHCFVDQVIDQEDVLCATGQSTECVSWGAAFMGLDQFKEAVQGDPSAQTAMVAVVDTGINASHTLFAGGRISDQSSNFSGDDQGLADVTGHGTHVAGIVADCTPDNVQLLVLRVFDQQGKSTALAIAKAIDYAVACQADVINLSVGWSQGKVTENIQGILTPAIDSAYAAGVPVVCAAGNDREDVSRSYPACSSQTIAVSSVDQTGAFDAQNSNFGSGVDFAAPGVDITSASRDGDWITMTGTSMAAPHLTAAIACVKLLQPELNDVPALCDTLKTYAVDRGEPGKDALYGWGTVNLATYYGAHTDTTRTCDNWSIQLDKDSWDYTGNDLKPTVTVLENGRKVAERFYTVSYQNNRAVGKATVVVTGTGIYQGTVKKTFTIRLKAPAISSLTNTAKGVALNWKKTPGATGYYVCRKSGKSNTWVVMKKLTSGKTVSWTDTSVSNGGSYHYQVRAFGEGGTTAKGAEQTIVFLSRPAAPKVKNSGKGTLTVSWKKNNKATGYQVQYAANRKFSQSKTVTVSKGKTTKASIKKLKKGKTYYVRTRSYQIVSGQNCFSAWSAAQKSTVKK